jgi:hypothetical protein
VDNVPGVHLFLSFLKLGTTAFGGPAMVAYIRRMSVDRNQWLDEATFQDGVALCQTIPGATAMQTAAYVGLRSRGLPGATVCFVGFGLPAFCFMDLSLHGSRRKTDFLDRLPASARVGKLVLRQRPAIPRQNSRLDQQSQPLERRWRAALEFLDPVVVARYVFMAMFTRAPLLRSLSLVKGRGLADA